MRVLGTWGKQLRFVPGSEENGARGPWDKFEWCCVAEEAKGHGFHTDLVLSYGSGIVNLTSEESGGDYRAQKRIHTAKEGAGKLGGAYILSSM